MNSSYLAFSLTNACTEASRDILLDEGGFLSTTYVLVMIHV